MRKSYVIVICLGFFLNAGAHITFAPSTLWKDTFYLPNDHADADQSLTNDGLAQDTAETNITHASSIALSMFKVALNYERVLLDWSTTKEPDNKYFTVERSNDGTTFNFLGLITANINSSESNNYRLIDYSPNEGLNYYRLSQTDRNGKIGYYGTRIINYNNSKDFSAGVINFSNGNIKMIINSGKKDDLNLILVDISGKEIMRQTFEVATGSTAKTILLKQGAYVAILSNSTGERAVNKIIIQ